MIEHETLNIAHTVFQLFDLLSVPRALEIAAGFTLISQRPILKTWLPSSTHDMFDDLGILGWTSYLTSQNGEAPHLLVPVTSAVSSSTEVYVITDPICMLQLPPLMT